MSEAIVSVTSRRRWDAAFGSVLLADEDVSRVLELAPFRDLDPRAFGGIDALRDLVRHEMRVLHCEPGDLLFRAGDYGTSAYLVVSGTMHLASGAPDQQLTVTGAPPQQRTKLGFLAALAQLRARRQPTEVRRGRVASANTTSTYRRVANLDAILAMNETRPAGPGEFFGELSALARTPRTASVFCAARAELVEVRWQGLRDLCRRERTFRAWVDRTYRERALQTELAHCDLLRHLGPEQLGRVRELTLFESHGERDWSMPYKELVDSAPSARLASEPVVAAEGDYPNGVLLVRRNSRP